MTETRRGTGDTSFFRFSAMGRLFLGKKKSFPVTRCQGCVVWHGWVQNLHRAQTGTTRIEEKRKLKTDTSIALRTEKESNPFLWVSCHVTLDANAEMPGLETLCLISFQFNKDSLRCSDDQVQGFRQT